MLLEHFQLTIQALLARLDLSLTWIPLTSMRKMSIHKLLRIMMGVSYLGDSGFTLDPADFAHLNNYKGQTLITTDGTTLLGADDKSGIAEIYDSY